MKYQPNHQRKARGFTLIEVLIAVVILSIGLLGLAGLQATSLRHNQSAYLRSKATLLAYDITDRARANRAGVAAGYYSSPTATEHSSCLTTTGCSIQEMAQNDYYQWTQAVSTQLPGGSGVICLDVTPDDGDDSADSQCSNSGTLYVVKIWWTDDREGTVQRFVTSFQP